MAKDTGKVRTCTLCPWRSEFPVYSGLKYACHLTGHNVFKNQTCVWKASDALLEALLMDNEGTDENAKST